MITIILLIIAGFLNACMDIVDFKFENSIFSSVKNLQWFNPALSHKNKWKNGDKNQGEKFFGSSTIFVFVTDFWHFCKILMLICIYFSIVFYFPLINWWVDIIIFSISFSLTFEIFFRILVKK